MVTSTYQQQNAPASSNSLRSATQFNAEENTFPGSNNITLEDHTAVNLNLSSAILITISDADLQHPLTENFRLGSRRLEHSSMLPIPL